MAIAALPTRVATSNLVFPQAHTRVTTGASTAMMAVLFHANNKPIYRVAVKELKSS